VLRRCHQIISTITLQDQALLHFTVIHLPVLETGKETGKVSPSLVTLIDHSVDKNWPSCKMMAKNNANKGHLC